MSNLCIMVRKIALVPRKLKQLVDIHAFKEEIKKWKPESCPCGLCKTFLNVFEYKFRSTRNIVVISH